METSMRERIAGAIIRAYFSRSMDLRQINVTVSDQLDLADAVLEEIQQPTEEMLNACNKIMGGGFQNSHSDLETWEAMIQEARKTG